MKRLAVALLLDLNIACQGTPATGFTDGSSSGLLGGQDSGQEITPGECVSGDWWTDGDRGSSKMHPGSDCNACHQREREGPIYAVAGTIYTDWEEPTDCYGPSDIEVLFQDGSGRELSAWSNSAGNFTLKKGDFDLDWPVHTAVVVGGEERWMDDPVTESDGSCNSCHTPEGTDGAPGRVVLP